jgi:hypothetical protein
VTGPNEFGVVIRAWSCPIGWHRDVKWYGAHAYCIEPGCDESNVEPPEVPPRRVVPVPRGVGTVNLPDAES